MDAIWAAFAALDAVFIVGKTVKTPNVWPGGVTVVMSISALSCAVVSLIDAQAAGWSCGLDVAALSARDFGGSNQQRVSGASAIETPSRGDVHPRLQLTWAEGCRRAEVPPPLVPRSDRNEEVAAPSGAGRRLSATETPSRGDVHPRLQLGRRLAGYFPNARRFAIQRVLGWSSVTVKPEASMKMRFFTLLISIVAFLSAESSATLKSA